ncbi:MAG TPA: hypothetical protein VND15_03000 [Candidatus Acidoferrales bacterium]|nr:hypothetical protein [Candidatus Acidoferrales bacterium]
MAEMKLGSVIKETNLRLPPEEVKRLLGEWKSLGILLRYDKESDNVELASTQWIRKDRATLGAVEEIIGWGMYRLREGFRQRMGYAPDNPLALGVCINLEMKLGWTDTKWKFDSRPAHLSGHMTMSQAERVAPGFWMFTEVMTWGINRIDAKVTD